VTWVRNAEALDSVLVFRDDVQVRFDGESAVLTSPLSSFLLRPLTPGLRSALRDLANGPQPMAGLLAALSSAEREQLSRFLGRAWRLTAQSIYIGPRELVRIERTTPDDAYRIVDVAEDAPVRLSRFALCRSRADTLVLESPLAKVRVLLVHRDARELVAALGSRCSASDLAREGPAVDEVVTLLGHLAGAGFLDIGDAEESLRQWDFHDALFHSRIRSGRFDEPFGAVYPYLGQLDPEPAVKQPPHGRSIELYRPALPDVIAGDPGLTATLEGRRSIRDHGERPLTATQLGEFLYRVARVRAHYVPDGEGGDGGDELATRPYPSGGGAYELELYLCLNRCAGVDQGIYYYDPVGHRLILVNAAADDRDTMLAVAASAVGVPIQPDVLITMTSRIRRLSWKYRAIAYATTLRHTGVLYQTMYLVATALGLAPCGLGNGDADLAARVLGLDEHREISVGDFLLGSRPENDSGIGRPQSGWRMLNSAEWAEWAGSELP
jgi:SagB-type dehydrogenase family enzyme